MNVASIFLLAITLVWAIVLIAMYLDHRTKTQKIKDVEKKLDAGAEKAEANRVGKIIPRTTLKDIDIEPGDQMTIEHDYMDACAHVLITRSEGTREHFAIDMDDDDNIARMNFLMAKARHQRRVSEGMVNAYESREFLERDARARQQGLNTDGTVRRETVEPKPHRLTKDVPQKYSGNLRDDLAQRRWAREAEERRRRDDTYDPLVVLPTVYEREEPKPDPSTRYAEPERLVPRSDPIMDGSGGKFTTGGSFGGESFSTGSSDYGSSDNTVGGGGGSD